MKEVVKDKCASLTKSYSMGMALLLLVLPLVKGWNKAVRQFGDADCTLGVPGKMYVVYTMAGHEVRNWLRIGGREGLLKLIDKIKSGESFEKSYRSVSP